MFSEYDLDHINSLDKILKDRDIKQIPSAISSGFHCPLYSVLMTALHIDDLAMLIVGTRECGFYAKTLAVRTHPEKQSLYTLVMDRHEITFGCGDELERAVKKIDADGQYRALMVITTCVPELTGTDIAPVLDGLRNEVSFDILTVRTDHFTTEVPVSGMSRTYAALADLMEAQHRAASAVNILGHRYKNFNRTELARALYGHGIEIQSFIPTTADIDSIRVAPRANLNIVTHFAAIPLAKIMKQTFGIPYIFFNHSLEPEMIKQDYEGIAETLALSSDLFPKDAYVHCLLEYEKLKGSLHGKTFVFSSPPIASFKICSFLSDLGMIPLWIQTVGLDSTDRIFLEKMLSLGVNPNVSRGKDSEVMAVIRDELKPDFYVESLPRGRSNESVFRQSRRVAGQKTLVSGKRTSLSRQIAIMEELGSLGFDQPLSIMEKIRQSL